MRKIGLALTGSAGLRLTSHVIVPRFATQMDKLRGYRVSSERGIFILASIKVEHGH